MAWGSDFGRSFGVDATRRLVESGQLERVARVALGRRAPLDVAAWTSVGRRSIKWLVVAALVYRVGSEVCTLVARLASDDALPEPSGPGIEYWV
jgi:hypothetical protein